MSEHLIRVNNLKSIQAAHGWNDSELGRQCGKSPQQVHSWFKGSREIGEKLARELEEKLQLRRFELDEALPAPKSRETAPTWGATRNARTSGTKSAREMPAFRWADVQRMFDHGPNAAVPAAHLKTLAASSDQARFVEMPDDSMAPVFSPGDHILFDPAETPRAGDVALIRDKTGEHFVRLYRPRSSTQFEAGAINSNYPSMSSASDDLTVVAVMTEHRRYRRAP